MRLKASCYLDLQIWLSMHPFHSSVCCHFFPHRAQQKLTHQPTEPRASSKAPLWNPHARFIFKPSLQVHSSNLPKTCGSFCAPSSLLAEWEALYQHYREWDTQSHPHSHPLVPFTLQNTDCIPGSAFQRAQVHYGNVFCHLGSRSSFLWAPHVCTSLSAL